MSKNRYTEKTEKSNAMYPLPAGSNNIHTTVKDNETGNKGNGWGNTEKESRDNAWKNLREKQGG